jgi:diaminobutyrate-2-oxoglutarate transaminase
MTVQANQIPAGTGIDASIRAKESEVRYYSRLFPVVLSKGSGSYVYDQDGNRYLDFFCGSGSLNYGHSNPVMKQAVIDYLQDDGIINGLDQMTSAKMLFMNNFFETIIVPRGFNYKMQFCGPTGTNCVEAAIKLARKYTGREKIVYFEHSFHGMSYGSMSVSGMKNKKLHKDYTKHTVEMPYAEKPESITNFKRYLQSVSAEELPAAVILETIQAEGGIKVAPKEWLEEVASIARDFGLLLIADEIQTGCGRTGTFFSFENINIKPDIVCLSKSLSGYGFPLSVNLINPAIDCWTPGEHNGTFRGNNIAFVSASRALEYWKTDAFEKKIMNSAAIIDDYFMADSFLRKVRLKGRGLMRGIELRNEEETMHVQKMLFKNGILMDVCGFRDNVIKIMPPITIAQDDLQKGLDIIHQSLLKCLS